MPENKRWLFKGIWINIMIHYYICTSYVKRHNGNTTFTLFTIAQKNVHVEILSEQAKRVPNNNKHYYQHYDDVILSLKASQITSRTSVYSTVYSGADQRKHQRFVTLAFVRRIHGGPVNSPHKRPVTRKMFPFDDVIMNIKHYWVGHLSNKYFHSLIYILLNIKC